MIITDYFIYIHVTRTGGTFLNHLIMNQVPGARMLRYHGHLGDLPSDYSQLPVIGFVRNPWDWYVSMYNDYRRKQQYVFQIISERGALDFNHTVARFLNLGDGSAESRDLLRKVEEAAPATLGPPCSGQKHLPGLKKEHFAHYPAGIGYYGWLFDLMFRSEDARQIHYGRFENLREDAMRLFEETGVSITKQIAGYLKLAPPTNAASRPKKYIDAYSPKLEQLLAEREQALIERFGYEFS